MLAKLAIDPSSKVVINFCIGGEYDAVQALFQACKNTCNQTNFQFLIHETLKKGNFSCWENINREETVQISSETKDLSVNAVEQLLTNTLGSSRARFHLLIPINGLVHPDEANSQSLVILFEHFGSSILFTGDATKDTLEAILGDRTSDSKAEDEKNENFFISATKSQIASIQQEEYFNIISAISKRNRRLLKCVNLIMESHHGSDEKGCDLWVPQIIKLSGDNFCGVLSSSDPLDGPYGHARHTVVSSVKFPDSAKSISKDVLTCSVVEPGYTSDRFQIKRPKLNEIFFKQHLFQLIKFCFVMRVWLYTMQIWLLLCS